MIGSRNTILRSRGPHVGAYARRMIPQKVHTWKGIGLWQQVQIRLAEDLRRPSWVLTLENNDEAEGFLVFFDRFWSAIQGTQLLLVIEGVLVGDFLKGVAIFSFTLGLHTGHLG